MARQLSKSLRLAGTVLAAVGLTACGDEPVPAPHRAVCEEPAQVAARARQAGEVRALTQCGPTLDFTPVNAYQGVFADVADREDAVVLINGRCTGTLVLASAGPVVITAGHCVTLDERPLLVFNYEDAPDGDTLRTEGTVFEWSDAPDYALIKLDTLPQVAPVLLSARPTEELAIIQHPRGRPKVIAEGRYVAACNQLVYYADVDTLVGSSGAGVLNRAGHLLGIHTDGDCDAQGNGTNFGWTVDAIVEASPYLVPEDVVAR
jgi:hypothetical protein